MYKYDPNTPTTNLFSFVFFPLSNPFLVFFHFRQADQNRLIH